MIGLALAAALDNTLAELKEARAEIERIKARPQPGEGVEEITKALRGVLAEIDYNVDQGVLHRVACVENPTFKKARAVLAALAPKPASCSALPNNCHRVTIHGQYDADSHCVLNEHGEPLVAFETDARGLKTLDGEQVSVTVRGE